MKNRMTVGGRDVRRASGRVLPVLLAALFGLVASAGLFVHLYRFIPPQERAPSAYSAIAEFAASWAGTEGLLLLRSGSNSAELRGR